MQVLLLRRRNREAPGLFVQDAAREAGSRPEERLRRADVSRRLSLPPIDKGHPTASRQLRPRYGFTRQHSLSPTAVTKLCAASTAVGPSEVLSVLLKKVSQPPEPRTRERVPLCIPPPPPSPPPIVVLSW